MSIQRKSWRLKSNIKPQVRRWSLLYFVWGWRHNIKSDSSPSGKKGQEPGRENRDKGWTGRGRWLTGSRDEWTARVKAGIDSRWRDLRFKCTNIGKSLFFASTVFLLEPIQREWVILEMGRHQIRWQGMRKEGVEDGQTGRLQGGQEINGHIIVDGVERIKTSLRRLCPEFFELNYVCTRIYTQKNQFESNECHHFSTWGRVGGGTVYSLVNHFQGFKAANFKINTFFVYCIHIFRIIWLHCNSLSWIFTFRVSKPLSRYVPYLFFSPVEA